jgi:hypothetical protein
MTPAPRDSDRLRYLVDAACTSEASDVELRELESAMLTDSDLRQYYTAYCRMHAELLFTICGQRVARAAREAVRDPGGAPPIGTESSPWTVDREMSNDQCPIYNDQFSFLNDQPPAPSPEHIALPIIIQTLPDPPSTFFSSFIGDPLFSYVVATMIVGVAVLVASILKVSSNAEVVTYSPPHSPVRDIQLPPPPKVEYVGRITGMVDCILGEGSGVRSQGPESDTHHSSFIIHQSRVALGDTFAIRSGLLEITYNSGAKVILQGPVTYKVESSASGYLSVGKLTARVEKGSGVRGQGSDASIHHSSIINHHLFAVRTPTATVTDLGTEFGVEVDKQGRTVSHVFRGLVRVQMLARSGKPEGIGQLLRENESARVDGGVGERRIIVMPAAKSAEFIRDIPKLKIKMLDLVDVVAGGNGFMGRRNRGIDPTTGQIADARPARRDIRGDHKYHRVRSLLFVDGVFIPDGGDGPVQVDSAGHTFDGFGKTSNDTVGQVWAGPVVSVAPDPPEVIPTDLGGVDYASPSHGLLFISANKAVTFDLEAIRRASPGRKLVRFRAVTGNREEASLHGEYVSADIWVLVDGQMRFQRREINNTQGVFQIAIPIGEQDRFLTLAATDGGNGVRWDWIMFGDPRLEIVERE